MLLSFGLISVVGMFVVLNFESSYFDETRNEYEQEDINDYY